MRLSRIQNQTYQRDNASRSPFPSKAKNFLIGEPSVISETHNQHH